MCPCRAGLSSIRCQTDSETDIKDVRKVSGIQFPTQLDTVTSDMSRERKLFQRTRDSCVCNKKEENSTQLQKEELIILQFCSTVREVEH